MTNRRLWRSHTGQAALFCTVLVLAWLWDAVSSGHLEQQIARLALGCTALAGVLVWMQRPVPPGRLR